MKYRERHVVKNLKLKFEFVGALRLTNSKNKRPFDTLIRKMCAQCSSQQSSMFKMIPRMLWVNTCILIWYCGHVCVGFLCWTTRESNRLRLPQCWSKQPIWLIRQQTKPCMFRHVLFLHLKRKAHSSMSNLHVCFSHKSFDSLCHSSQINSHFQAGLLLCEHFCRRSWRFIWRLSWNVVELREMEDEGDAERGGI